MDIVLKNSDFVNSKLYVTYGVRQEAMFTIIDETFAGLNTLGNINRVTCMVRKLDANGGILRASMAAMVIGIGDGQVGITSADASLRGKLLTHDNMEQCVVTLYEDTQ
jgi:hypothetical protein